MRARLTYANVTATLALAIAMGGGSAYAINEWDGSNIQDETLTGDDVRGKAATDTAPAVKGSLKGEDVYDGSITSKDIAVDEINSARIRNEALTTDDIDDGSLAMWDLNASVFRSLVHSDRAELMFVDQDRGSIAEGTSSTVTLLGRRSDHFGSGPSTAA